MRIEDDYPHLSFQKRWELSQSTCRNLGGCVEIIKLIRDMPIAPKLQAKLRQVAFSRGAQATTAIEGNTLTDDEIRKILDGQELPKSREYQAQEVKNALAAMEHVWSLVVKQGANDLVTPQLLCELNRIVGKDLGVLYDGVPGRFRRDRRHVGRYLAPPPEVVEELVSRLCDWLKSEFRFSSGGQRIDEAIVEAIVAHVYFEWIHPFADGNGRTGRLLEFFILLRGGLPDVAAHVLANHYNLSRAEYAGHFDSARQHRDLSDFIAYAVQGLLDGLRATAGEIQNDLWRIVWRSHVYDVFSDYTDYRKRSVFKRRRSLALSMPPGPTSPEKLLMQSEDLVRQYLHTDRRTLLADLQVLVDLGLVDRDGENFSPAMHRLSTHIVGYKE